MDGGCLTNQGIHHIDLLRRMGGEVMIIGGATLYEALLPRADRLYLTEIHETAEGDTYFPAFDKGEWREVAREDRDDIYRAPVSFVTLDRRG